MLVQYEKNVVASGDLFQENQITDFFAHTRKCCPCLWALMDTALNVKRAQKNTIRTPEWNHRFALLIIFQILKLRSERASLFQYFFFGYFMSKGLPVSGNALLGPTLTGDAAHYHVKMKEWVNSSNQKALQGSVLFGQSRDRGRLMVVGDNLEKYVKSPTNTMRRELIHMMTIVAFLAEFESKLPPPRYMTSTFEVIMVFSPYDLDLEEGGPDHVIQLIATELHHVLGAGGVIAKPTKEHPTTNTSRTEWNPLAAQQLNGLKVPDMQLLLQYIEDAIQLKPGETLNLVGDGLFCRNVGIAAQGFGSSTVLLHVGLFHYMWNVAMRLVWLWYSRIDEVKVEVKGVVFPRVTKVWSAHCEVVSAAQQAYTESAYEVRNDVLYFSIFLFFRHF
jgi:hypothetical protein